MSRQSAHVVHSSVGGVEHDTSETARAWNFYTLDGFDESHSMLAPRLGRDVSLSAPVGCR